MQQTADVDAKEQIMVDADLETILVSGSSYFFYSVADAVLTVADVAMTAACGLSSYCSAVAVSEATEVEMDADATTVATRINPS